MPYQENVIEIVKTPISAGQASNGIVTANYRSALLMLRGSSNLVVELQGFIAKNPASVKITDTQWVPQQSINGPGLYAITPLLSLTRLKVITGTLDEATIEVSQDVLPPTAAPSSGSSLIGQVMANTNAIATVGQTTQSNTQAINQLTASLSQTNGSITALGNVINTQALALAAAQERLNNLPEISAKDYGVKADGATDDTAALQSFFNALQGKSGVLPVGRMMVRGDFLLPDGQFALRGAGPNTEFFVMNNSNPAAVLRFRNENVNTYHIGVRLSGFVIDGNRANNTNGIGLILHNWQLGWMQDVRVLRTPKKGILLTGTYGAVGDQGGSNTCHLVDCRVFNAGEYGVELTGGTLDMHIQGGDYGLCSDTNILMGGPSSSIRDATVWASQGQGILLNSISIQVWGCQIEGNKRHGIWVSGADHAMISGNKIYDNANTPETYGLYDGIYVDADSMHPSITGNFIIAGYYGPGSPYGGDGTGYHRAGIYLETRATPRYAYINGNDVAWQDNGRRQLNRDGLTGVMIGDIVEGVEIRSTASMTSAPIAPYALAYNATVGRFGQVIGGQFRTFTVPGDDTTSVQQSSIRQGVKFIGSNADTVSVVLDPPYPDANYVVLLTLQSAGSAGVLGALRPNGFDITVAPVAANRNCFYLTSKLP